MGFGQVGPGSEAPEEPQTTEEEADANEGEKYEGGPIPEPSPPEQDES